MARAGHEFTAQDSAGNILPTTAVEVRYRSDNSLAPIYDAETGGSAITQPGFQTDANGDYEFWAHTGEYNVTVGAGASAKTYPLDLSAPDSDVAAFLASTATYQDNTYHSTEKEGFSYKAVPSGGDGRVQNAGLQWFEVQANHGVVDAKAFGYVGDGSNDDTTATQAALDSGFDVVITGSYLKVSSALQLGTGRLIGAPEVKILNRMQVIVTPTGDHAAFVNKSGFPNFKVDGFFVDYGSSTPTVASGNDNKIAFHFTENTSSWPEYIDIKNITVRGAWYGFYDDTGTYLSKLTQVACRNTRNGFFKSAGTTIHFDTCSSSDGVSGFRIENCISPILTNCSADGLTVSAGEAGNYFNQITSLTINGWDGESNTMTGNQSCYMQFNTTTGVVNGMSGLLNSLVGTTGEEVYFLYASANSNMTFNGFRVTRDANWLTYTGTGGSCFTLKNDTNGQCALIGSDFAAPTGGSPTTRYSVAGTNGAWISLIETFTDNTKANIAFESANGIVEADNRFSIPTGTADFGTQTSLSGGQQYGGFGSEKYTFQGSGNGPLFSTTGGINSGVPAQYARGNDGPLMYFFRNGSAGGYINITSSGATFHSGSNQVVGPRQAAVSDASGGATVDAEARTAVNDLLARLRTHGLIST